MTDSIGLRYDDRRALGAQGEHLSSIRRLDRRLRRRLDLWVERANDRCRRWMSEEGSWISEEDR